MHTQQISIFELNAYWRKVAEFAKGGDSFDVLSRQQFPAWTNICSELSWKLHLATGGYFSKKRHGYCGVYRLVGLSSDGDLKRPATLMRVCGEDPTGTLYIGQAGRLNMRLNQLRRGRHNASSLPAILRKNFPPERLAIAVLFTPRCTEWIENDLIRAYIQSFGDTPPLNYRVNL